MTAELTLTEIVVVVLLATIALVLLGLIIYKVLAARRQRSRMLVMEQGTTVSDTAHEEREKQAMETKQSTANELDDLRTKASKSDKNSEEQHPSDEPPSLNAQELIQNVFAPETDDRISRPSRRKVNKLMKKNASQSSS